MSKYKKKFYKVSFVSRDGVKFSSLFMGGSPSQALKSAKQSRPAYKRFSVGKTAYNALGEKIL